MRPASIDKHLTDLERFFTEDESGQGPPEWQFGTGHDFDAQRAVRALRRYIGRLERSQPTEGVTVPEWAVIQSCRYGFGRRSYALGMTCDHLRDVWPRLPEDTRVVIRRDLAEAIDVARRYPDVGGDENYGLRVLLKLRDDLSKHDKDAA